MHSSELAVPVKFLEVLHCLTIHFVVYIAIKLVNTSKVTLNMYDLRTYFDCWPLEPVLVPSATDAAASGSVAEAVAVAVTADASVQPPCRCHPASDRCSAATVAAEPTTVPAEACSAAADLSAAAGGLASAAAAAISTPTTTQQSING